MTTRKKAVPGKHSAPRQLAKYRAKRNFKVTSEPSGSTRKKGSPAKNHKLAFAIQKHAASRLHYDFRLEWNGVLKSWAVAKGPSYYPGDKRLAVQVEDHPLEYGGFEGIIPKGQYGGGTVMLWDRGTWEPQGDAAEGLRAGNLKFTLYGDKLRGNWVLVRMGGRLANESKPNWLLIKERDGQERGADEKPITEEAPDSVLSGRDIEAIALAQDKVWNSAKLSSHPREPPKPVKAPATGSRAATPKAHALTRNSKRLVEERLARAARESLPAFIEPQLASMAAIPPENAGWIHELKLDGYRIQAHVQSAAPHVQLLTRTGLDWTHRMPSIADALARLSARTALLDGEVVVLSGDGTTSFASLQAAFQDGSSHPLTYFAFDLLHLNGRNLRALPLLERKETLSALLSGLDPDGPIRVSEHIGGGGGEVFGHACRLGAEGIVSKQAQGKYLSGRSRGWLKLKCYREQEFVIGGFTLPSNGMHGVGALLLGYYDNGNLIYAGRSGTGFTQQTHRMMRARLDGLRSKSSPFASLPAGAARSAHWVKPELVAQVSFATWTADNIVRQAAFKGLREDKPAKSVHLEEVKQVPIASESTAKAGKSARHAKESRVATKAERAKDTTPLPIPLTHPAKVLDAASGLTKDQLARYYLAVAPYMLLHIADRPLSLVRCMNGSDKPCFFQKHRNETLPSDFESVDIIDKKTGKPEPYIALSTPQAIAELAQLSVLEIHPWGSHNGSIEKPDRIIVDLDPDAAIDWKTLTAAAVEVRKRLRSAGLESFVKATGGKGLHVVAPIRPEHDWPTVKDFAHNLVLAMEADDPALFLTRMTKSARKGKIYLDYLRNERGATSIAPFSPRAREGVPVAVPLSWAELKAPERQVFTVSEFARWKDRLMKDPWKEMLKTDQRLHI